jgi:hypothetical protein
VLHQSPGVSSGHTLTAPPTSTQIGGNNAPCPLNGWPAYSGSGPTLGDGGDDSLGSSALQESQTFYDAQSVINSITQSMIASTHSFFDYVYGQVGRQHPEKGSSVGLPCSCSPACLDSPVHEQGTEDVKDGYEDDHTDDHLGAGLGLGAPEILLPTSLALNPPANGHPPRPSHSWSLPPLPPPPPPQAPAPELWLTLQGEGVQVALMYPGTTSAASRATTSSSVDTPVSAAEQERSAQHPDRPLPPPSQPCLVLSLTGVEVEAERPRGSHSKWVGLRLHHVQLLEMLHDSSNAPVTSSKGSMGGPASSSLFSLPNIERQALEFAAVPGRLPQVRPTHGLP